MHGLLTCSKANQPVTTLCIVEDLPDIRNSLVSKANEMPNVDFLAAYATAEDALKGIPMLDPDLVIMDIGLPKMKGVECIARLKQMGVRASFLMFTVFDHEDHLFQALSIGASGYILKVEGAKGVQKAIEEWQQGGAPMSRSIAQKVLSSFSQPRVQSNPPLEKLTPRQREILELIASGLLNKQIAAKLEISEATVKQHNVQIYKKLSVNNRAEAILKYLNKR